MDAFGFDRLARDLSAAGTRRALVRLLATLPIAGALLATRDQAGEAGRPSQGKDRHREGAEQRRARDEGKKGKSKCARVGQTLKKGKRKRCCAGLSQDASGRCASPVLDPDSTPGCTNLRPTNTSATRGLQEAIGAASGPTLTLCAGIWALSDTVVIDKELTLAGAGEGQTILDGGDAVRVLSVAAGAEVTLLDLTIRRGLVAPGLPFPDDSGGGILNQGTLTLKRVSVTESSAGFGGGIYNDDGTLTLQANSSVSGNQAQSGGGIASADGTVTLQANSSVSDNESVFVGGGIFNDTGGTLTLEAKSLVSENTAGGDGGGLFNLGTLTLQAESLLSHNEATTDGGGIFNGFPGTVLLEAESRVSDNEAGDDGGAIYNDHSGTVTVQEDAIICSNSQGVPGGTQCAGPSTVTGTCPQPDATCPTV